MTRELRSYQHGAIALVRASLASDRRRPALQLPTGGGKTRIAAEIVLGALRKGRRVIFTVPALQLIDQTVEAFWREGIREIGVLQGNHPLTNPNMPVQVASVQTLAKRHIPRADLVIIDECHRVFALYEKWMSDPDWADVPFIGLSATPWTRGLGKYFDDLLIAATTSDLIDAGHLAPFRVFAPSHPDLSQVKTVAGDYHEGQLSEVMRDAPLVADVVSTWRDKAEGRPTIAFAVDRAHAQLLQQRFAEAGIASEYADAFTPREERSKIGERLRRGETKVVCNVGIFTTGTDWPFVSCLIMARPTRSEMLYVQMVGRALRTCEGKRDALILDHSDATLRLGFVTDIHHTDLDDGSPKAAATRKRQEREKPLPGECLGCGALKPKAVRVCPCCGYAPARQSNVEVADGNLIEMKGGRKADPY